MTDYELNKAIAKLVYPELVIYRQNNKVRVQDNDDFYVDYCNNWNDLMPLVIENFIGYEIYKNEIVVKDLMFDIEYIGVFHKLGGSCSTEYRDKITKRVLAECLLKVLEAKR